MEGLETTGQIILRRFGPRMMDYVLPKLNERLEKEFGKIKIIKRKGIIERWLLKKKIIVVDPAIRDKAWSKLCKNIRQYNGDMLYDKIIMTDWEVNEFLDMMTNRVFTEIKDESEVRE